MTKFAIAIVLSTTAVVACSKTPEPSTKGAPSASVASASPQIIPSAAASVLNPSAPFEGEILMTVTNESSQKLPTSLTYDIKGDKVRYAPATPSVRAIDDQKAQQAFTIDDTTKSYEQVDTKTAANAKTPPDPKVQKTEKVETIAGLPCNDWTIDSGDSKVDVCAASNIAFFDLERDTKSGALEPAWATALTKAKAFPLRVVVHDKAGKEQYRVQATKADRKKLDDTLFAAPPTTFKKTDLASDERQAALP